MPVAVAPVLLTLWAVALSAYMGFRLGIFPLVPGGDTSATYAVSYGAVHGLVFGRDLVWTMGPYGYLIDAVDVGDIMLRRVAWDAVLVLACGLAAAGYTARSHPRGVLAAAGTSALLVYAIHVQSPDYRFICLAIVVALVSLRSTGRTALLALGLAGALAGFLLLVKFSMGLGAVPSVIACALLSRPASRRPGRVLLVIGAAALALVVGWLAHARTAAGLGTYLATLWNVSATYASAFSSAPDRWWIALAAVLAFVAGLVIWVCALPPGAARLSLLALAVPLYVAARHGLVRQDSHIRLFVLFGVFVLAVVVIDALSVWPKTRVAGACAVLVVPLLVVWTRPESSPSVEAGLAALRAQALAPLEYHLPRNVSAALHHEAGHRWLSEVSRQALESRRLPPSFRQAIGTDSVDAYPWDASFVPANGLTWANRPVPQSFFAATPLLDGLDAAFFDSARRPRFLLWHAAEPGLRSVDDRYLLWDEPRTLRTLMARYQVVQARDDLLLLRARDDATPPGSRTLGAVKAAWGQWVDVPDPGGPVLAEVRFRRRLAMRVRRWVFREDPVFLSVRFAAGGEQTYRVVPDQLASGLWISPLPTTMAELASVLQGGPARRVAAIRVHSGPFGRLAPDVEVSWLAAR